MPDFTRIELASLSAARKKLRKLTVEAERSGNGDMVHSAYKAQQFLADALPDAWGACEERAPDHAPEDSHA